jgi:Rps23 Pro-64 3,4-dihydroxylase Tpa1-like proline 4-hydroxylase
LTDHFDVLTSLASYLNENYEIEESPYKPLLPATEDSPVTNPERIQLAEYENSGFYTAHSDNPIVQDSSGSGLIRENFRRFTAILYMNEGWTKGDGGAVRLYLRSQALQYVQEVYSESEEPRWHVVDVLPSNGRLLLFDSRLVHSVEPVLSEKKRRALTLWIKRPMEGGV